MHGLTCHAVTATLTAPPGPRAPVPEKLPDVGNLPDEAIERQSPDPSAGALIVTLQVIEMFAPETVTWPWPAPNWTFWQMRTTL